MNCLYFSILEHQFNWFLPVLPGLVFKSSVETSIGLILPCKDLGKSYCWRLCMTSQINHISLLSLYFFKKSKLSLSICHKLHKYENSFVRLLFFKLKAFTHISHLHLFTLSLIIWWVLRLPSQINNLPQFHNFLVLLRIYVLWDYSLSKKIVDIYHK